ncbi:hypothetical protein PSI19_19785 [Xenorhabdus khoisanae]|uniref:hypothetical protein n=1 Tax=Xenorhabdus khoisanae TaxID=880157 RepID=UPI002358274B|nr:hypothetical protein [Xenorhabdus khoisanae]MDC9616055.1 hypothetical protein [Xenorhabdus khoisanae]
MIRSLVRIAFGQRHPHSRSLQESTHCVVHLRTFGSRYRLYRDDEGSLIYPGTMPVTRTGNSFPSGRGSPSFLLAGEHGAKK